MHKTKVFQLIKPLSKKDQRALRKFLDSPYFNQREDVIQLFEYILKLLKKPQVESSLEKAFQHIFPEQSYDAQQFRYTMSFLVVLIKEFFVLEHQKEASIEKQLTLCRSLRKRGFTQLFEQEWKQLKKMQQSQDLRNYKYHLNNYNIAFEYYEHFLQHSRHGKIYLPEMAEELSHYVIAAILRHSCLILAMKNLWDQDFKLDLLEEVLSSVRQESYDDIPAIAIYYHGYCALSNLENEDNFLQLKDLIYKHWEQFPKDEIRDIYLMAINYCIKQLNRGARHYIQEALDLYRSGLENKSLLEDGFLSSFNYKNVLRLGMGLQEYDWVEKFMEEYKDYLHPKEKENTYVYNLAFFYFQKPDYDRAIDLLQKVEFKDVFNNLDARRMLLRIYFELKEFDALDSLLDSFKTYIHRQKDIGYHRNNYLNLIRFVRKILQLQPSDKSERLQLRQKIESTKAIAEKEWLLQQLA